MSRTKGWVQLRIISKVSRLEVLTEKGKLEKSNTLSGREVENVWLYLLIIKTLKQFTQSFLKHLSYTTYGEVGNAVIIPLD